MINSYTLYLKVILEKAWAIYAWKFPIRFKSMLEWVSTHPVKQMFVCTVAVRVSPTQLTSETWGGGYKMLLNSKWPYHLFYYCTSQDEQFLYKISKQNSGEREKTTFKTSLRAKDSGLTPFSELKRKSIWLSPTAGYSVRDIQATEQGVSHLAFFQWALWDTLHCCFSSLEVSLLKFPSLVVLLLLTSPSSFWGTCAAHLCSLSSPLLPSPPLQWG